MKNKKKPDPIDEPTAAAPGVDAPADVAAAPTDEASVTSPTAAAPPASGLVRCRVKAGAGDFHLDVDGQHVPMAPGTELSLTPEQLEGLASHVEPIE